jgi:hypothetical protein
VAYICYCTYEGNGARLYLMVCTKLRTPLYLMLDTQLLLLWLNLQAFFCCRPFPGVLNKNTGCLFPCLQGMANALLGMALTMQIFNQKVPQSNLLHVHINRCGRLTVWEPPPLPEHPQAYQGMPRLHYCCLMAGLLDNHKKPVLRKNASTSSSNRLLSMTWPGWCMGSLATSKTYNSL